VNILNFSAPQNYILNLFISVLLFQLYFQSENFFSHHKTEKKIVNGTLTVSSAKHTNRLTFFPHQFSNRSHTIFSSFCTAQFITLIGVQ
jgi:hypothetical protein